jgi:hypothetical protein
LNQKEGQAHFTFPSAPAWAVTITLVAMAAVISSGLFTRHDQAILYFADVSGTKLVAERRVIRLEGDMEGRAEIILRELLLGPVRRDAQSLFAPTVWLRMVIYRGGKLYIDFSSDAALADPVPIHLAVRGIESSLRESIPGLAPLLLTIGGMEIFRY